MFGSDPRIERIVDITEKILSLVTKQMQEDAPWKNTMDKTLGKINRALQDVGYQIDDVDNGLESGLLRKFEEARRASMIWPRRSRTTESSRPRSSS